MQQKYDWPSWSIGIQILRLEITGKRFSVPQYCSEAKRIAIMDMPILATQELYINEIGRTFSLQARKRQINRKYIHNNASFWV